MFTEFGLTDFFPKYFENSENYALNLFFVRLTLIFGSKN